MSPCPYPAMITITPRVFFLIIAHEIDKRRLQIVDTLLIKGRETSIDGFNFEHGDNFLKRHYFFNHFFLFLDNVVFLLIAFYFLNSSVSQFYPILRLRNFVML